MPKVTHAARVGLFLVVCAVALFVVLKTIDKGGSIGGAYKVHAFLKDATGLAVHSRITIAGIPVGTIDSIKLENGRARFDIRMNKDVALYDNATIGKKSALVLGEATLVLTPGTENYRKLKDGDEITHVIEFTETADVLDEVKQIADKVRLVAEQLANAIGSQKGGQNMGAILQNLADATDAMNQTIRENRGYLKETLRNVDSITTNGAPELAKILVNIRQITDDVKALTAVNQGGGKGGGDEDAPGHARPHRFGCWSHRSRGGDDRAPHEGRDAHQRGAGGRRRGQRLRRRNHAAPDDRRATDRL
jgi:phospholipid/cholesterol/gamma-HCH transport system substrate-binding protein